MKTANLPDTYADNCCYEAFRFFFSRDTDGRTPLHFAAAKGSLKSVQLICAASPNCINVEDNADQVRKRQQKRYFLSSYIFLLIFC